MIARGILFMQTVPSGFPQLKRLKFLHLLKITKCLAGMVARFFANL